MKASRWLFLFALLGWAIWFFSASSIPAPEKAEIRSQEPEAAVSTPQPIGPPSPQLAAPREVEARNAPMVNTDRPQSTARSGRKGIDAGAEVPGARKEVILRDATGRVLRAKQKDAAKACSSRGMHLPTLRELAELAEQRGAKGLKELHAIEEPDLAAGYVLHTPTNPDGKRDDFYYNRRGYREPDRKVIGEIFWSSSACVGCVEGTGADSAYAFSSVTGEIADKYATIPYGVRCLQP